LPIPIALNHWDMDPPPLRPSGTCGIPSIDVRTRDPVVVTGRKDAVAA
jgi:hypothetical protein